MNRSRMVAYEEYENMMEAKDEKITDLEEEIEALKEELQEEKTDYAYFVAEITRVIEASK